MRALVHHLRSQAVAYLALFIALGGTGYAAIALPHNSVGTAQLRNGAVTPAKLAGREIGGTIWAWAEVSFSGKVSGGRGLRLVRVTQGHFGFSFRSAPPKGCGATASVVYVPSENQGITPGEAVANLEYLPRPVSVGVDTYSTTGEQTGLPFLVEVVC